MDPIDKQASNNLTGDLFITLSINLQIMEGVGGLGIFWAKDL